MSLRSKFRQLLGWINEHRANDEFAAPEFTTTDPYGNDTWKAGETAAAGEQITLGNFATLIDFMAGFIDSKTGEGQAPTKGPVTGNVNNDAFILFGGAAVIAWFVFKLLR